jgi:tryptophan synthase alpha subunit
MVKLLKFLKDFDGLGIKIIVISDGEPDEKDETLRIAKTFATKIDTVFVGSETGRGRDFLRDLSTATGGISINNKTSELNLLSSNLRLLLGA